ncbi:MAG: YkgJ family cysteine cluster protein [Synechococcus sp.]
MKQRQSSHRPECNPLDTGARDHLKSPQEIALVEQKSGAGDRPTDPIRGAVEAKFWHCVNGCGACCYLKPDERDELADYLAPEELKLYLSLVGEDGWCVNYDRQQRTCHIYDDRPSFCRVTVATFQQMFGIEAGDLPEFAAACCREHISDVYGEDSTEMQRFNQEVPV